MSVAVVWLVFILVAAAYITAIVFWSNANDPRTRHREEDMAMYGGLGVAFLFLIALLWTFGWALWRLFS